MNHTVRILGTRGLPARHGGFETFAQHLSLHLVREGWRVVVYCQSEGIGSISEDLWHGVERIHIPVRPSGPRGTILFDWLATRHAAGHRSLCLTLGYNTAIFCAWLRLRGVRNIINMDGIEWHRQKWGALAKSWFWLNDWAGCWLADHLVADNPGIADHLATRVGRKKITMIPYGSDRMEGLPAAPVRALGLEPGRYWTLVARPEPENSVLEIVAAFSSRPRGRLLAVLGHYDPVRNRYHRKVLDAASDEVRFLGAIYDESVVQSLRVHAEGYLHGHQVGGTNPSLVEAMGAGNPVVAFDNSFNRWVAGDGARYFRGQDGCAAALQTLIGDTQALGEMRARVRERHAEAFQWSQILSQYESLLGHWLHRGPPGGPLQAGPDSSPVAHEKGA